MSAQIILETEELTKEFAGFMAVSGVNLQIARGSIHALIGPNGAGKTTCFNLLTKFLKPTRGRILYRRPRYHGACTRRCGPARPGPLVSNLLGVSPSHRAGKCAHRVAAQARWVVRLLALQPGSGRPQRPCIGADRGCRP